jgi:hypothetical protein
MSTVWPSGLRRWLQVPVRKGVGSNPTAVIYSNDGSFESYQGHVWYQCIKASVGRVHLAQLLNHEGEERVCCLLKTIPRPGIEPGSSA